jgi:hypothetical protein
VDHQTYGQRWLYCEGKPELLFTENETNAQRLFGGLLWSKQFYHYVIND